MIFIGIKKSWMKLPRCVWYTCMWYIYILMTSSKVLGILILSIVINVSDA